MTFPTGRITSAPTKPHHTSAFNQAGRRMVMSSGRRETECAVEIQALVVEVCSQRQIAATLNRGSALN